MEENDKYFNYYDRFTSDQKKEEIDVRHLHILEKLVQAGMKASHKVLEVGCGIGELSHLMASKVRHGKVLALDINQKNIHKARELWAKQENLQFEVSDMKDLHLPGETFDYFVFPDIMEQISSSRDRHFRLFENVKRHSHENSIIFVHLPTPQFLEWRTHNDPELLQTLDAAVSLGDLVKSISENNFHLHHAATYSVFYEEHDYQYLIFKPVQSLSKPTPKSKWALKKEKLQFNLMSLLM